jgi:hypothetical protein
MKNKSAGAPSVQNDIKPWCQALMKLSNRAYGNIRDGYIERQRSLRQDHVLIGQKLNAYRRSIPYIYVLATFTTFALAVSLDPALRSTKYILYTVGGLSVAVFVFAIVSHIILDGLHSKKDQGIDRDALGEFDRLEQTYVNLFSETARDAIHCPDDLVLQVKRNIVDVVWLINRENIARGPTDVNEVNRVRIRALVDLSVRLGVCGAEKTTADFSGYPSEEFYKKQARAMYIRLFGEENVGAC